MKQTEKGITVGGIYPAVFVTVSILDVVSRTSRELPSDSEFITIRAGSIPGWGGATGGGVSRTSCADGEKVVFRLVR